MSNNIKNWLIGGLIVAMLVLGHLFLKGETQTSNTSESTSTQSQETTTTLANCISTKEAWNHIGETLCVEYYVASPFQSTKGNVFLNEKSAYKTGFTAVIFSSALSRFNGNPVSLYGNKTIQVSGNIRTYQDHPEIIVNDPSQISVIK